ncbi:MAG: hypothetical protein U5R31_06620 [Acidimicrobiia bacterium]|nr:hypothetical protein [Acidimicrobiia bacterium]
MIADQPLEGVDGVERVGPGHGDVADVVDREGADEDAEPGEERPVVVERVPGRGDGRVQRSVPGPRHVPQQAEAVVEELEHLARPEQARASRRQLDGEGYPVQVVTEPAKGGVVDVDRCTRIGGARREEGRRRVGVERVERIHRFAVGAKRLATGRQDRDRRTARPDAPHQLTRRRNHVLAVVEHEQPRTRFEHAEEGFGGVRVGLLPFADRRQNEVGDRVRVASVGELAEPPSVAGTRPLHEGPRQRRLPDAGWTGDRHKAVLAQPDVDRCQVGLTTEQGSGRGRRPRVRRARCRRRRRGRVGVHLGDEPVADAMDRFDHRLGPAVVTDGGPGVADLGGEGRLADEAVSPHRVEQLLLGHRAVPVLEQVREDVEGAWLELDSLVGDPQLPGFGVEHDRTEAVAPGDGLIGGGDGRVRVPHRCQLRGAAAPAARAAPATVARGNARPLRPTGSCSGPRRRPFGAALPGERRSVPGGVLPSCCALFGSGGSVPRCDRLRPCGSTSSTAPTSCVPEVPCLPDAARFRSPAATHDR